MTTTSILILLLLSSVLLLMKHIRTGTTVLILTVIYFLSIGDGVLPSVLLTHLQRPFIALAQPQWKHNNAIILLGAGTSKLPITDAIYPTIIAYSRINETAHLYRACIKEHRKCTVIISGGDALKQGQSEAMVYRNVLLDLGVSDANITLEPDSMNTFQNAQFTSTLLKNHPFDQVILVTAGIHLTRALSYFSYFGINAIPAMADYLAAQYSILPLGYNLAMMDFAMHEYIGMAQFHIYNFFGWNKLIERNRK